MGLRKGELQGLQWKDINFNNKMIKIHKQIPSIYSMDNYKISPLKTKNSNRDLPINDLLIYDLKKLYNKQKEYKNFNQECLFLEMNYPFLKMLLELEKIKIVNLMS